MQALKTLGGVLRNRYLGQSVPVAITMALTFRCNLRCGYCQIWEEARQEMTTRQVKAAIDELTAAGMCRLGFTGGEPLLRPDIHELALHARKRGLFTTIFTNGALVDGHMDTMKLFDVVLMSLDGPAKYHDKMRGKGTHAKAIHALKVLTGAGIKVWTNTVVTKKNIGSVDWVLDLARHHGSHAAFQPIFEHSYSVGAGRIASLRADQDEYNALIEHLAACKRQGAPVLNSTRYLEYVRNPNWKQNPRHCLAAHVYGAVSPEGNVAPCPVLLQADGLPNGMSIGFAEAFRRTHKPVACHGCFCIATVESDLLFGLDSGAVTNTLGYLAQEKLRTIQHRIGNIGASGGQGGGTHASVGAYPECEHNSEAVLSD